MKTEKFLSEELLKQFKTSEQFNYFLTGIQKRAIEKMPKDELDDHLGYDKRRQQDIIGWQNRPLEELYLYRMEGRYRL